MASPAIYYPPAPVVPTRFEGAVDQTRTVSDDTLLRFAVQDETSRLRLEVTTPERASEPAGLGQITIDPGGAADRPRDAVRAPLWLQDVATVGDAVYVIRADTTRTAAGTGGWPIQVATVDIAKREQPVLTASVELGFGRSRVYPGYRSAVISAGKEVIAVGPSLLFTQDDYLESPEGVTPVRSALRVVSMQDPQAPSSTAVEWPHGMPASGLFSSGAIVARSRFVPSPETRDSVRFYLDRIDFSDPEHPALLPPVRVPGSLLSFDAATGHAVTVDYTATSDANVTERACFDGHARTRFLANLAGDPTLEPGSQLGMCTAISYALHLIAIDDGAARILGTVDLPERESPQFSALGEDRLFIALGSDRNSTWDNQTTTTPQARSVLVLGGTQSGSFSQGRLIIDGDDIIGIYPRIAAAGTHAVVASTVRDTLSLIEAKDAAAPSLVRQEVVAGKVMQMNVAGAYFIAALGPDGVAVLPLE